MTAAVLTRLPELDWDPAARLAKTDERLAKYDPDESRDWHGRWTTGGGGHSTETATSSAATRNAVDQNGGTSPSRSQSHRDLEFTPLSANDLLAPLPVQHVEEYESPVADLENKYDELGPVELADQAIRFGEQLARHGKDLSPEEQKAAAREYEFLQSRVSFWQSYDQMPPGAIANIDTAAQSLFQGAVLGGIVSAPTHYTDLPPSYLTAAAAAPPADDNSGIGGRHPILEEHFPGETALTPHAAKPALPDYIDGGKTVGALRTPSGDITLTSGWNGPSSLMPPKSSGFDIVRKTHVEGHAAAYMRQYDLSEATLFINNPAICVSCIRNLPKMLPPGASLKVITPDGISQVFVGITK